MVREYFDLDGRQTNVKTEIVAGLTTFLTMAYIIFVNPGILSAAGVPFEGAATATALGAALMCVAMGFISNRPLALASGMGLNAVVTFSIIGFQQANVPWQVGMSGLLTAQGHGFLQLFTPLDLFQQEFRRHRRIVLFPGVHPPDLEEVACPLQRPFQGLVGLIGERRPLQ